MLFLNNPMMSFFLQTGRALRAHQVLQHVQDLQERQGLPQDQVLSS